MRRLEFHTISLPSLTSLSHGDISPTITDLTDVREHLGNGCNERVRGERMRRLEFHTISLPSLTSLTYGNISVMGVMKESEGENAEIRISLTISSILTDLTGMYGTFGKGVMKQPVRGWRQELHTIGAYYH
ncbi:hypothetical protein J6590_045623 [Homalodisca vitripennis]|nr:hypothetical protein J6590_045623 [Homalodisca vitripennis]